MKTNTCTRNLKLVTNTVRKIIARSTSYMLSCFVVLPTNPMYCQTDHYRWETIHTAFYFIYTVNLLLLSIACLGRMTLSRLVCHWFVEIHAFIFQQYKHPKGTFNIIQSEIFCYFAD